MHIPLRIKTQLQITYELDGFPALVGSSFEVENDEILFAGLKHEMTYKWYQ